MRAVCSSPGYVLFEDNSRVVKTAVKIWSSKFSTPYRDSKQEHLNLEWSENSRLYFYFFLFLGIMYFNLKKKSGKKEYFFSFIPFFGECNGWNTTLYSIQHF